MITRERLQQLACFSNGDPNVCGIDRDIEDMARALLALQWRPITETDLPKVGDEVLDWEGVWNVDESDVRKGYEGWRVFGATHFRPIAASERIRKEEHAD